MIVIIILIKRQVTIGKWNEKFPFWIFISPGSLPRYFPIFVFVNSNPITISIIPKMMNILPMCGIVVIHSPCNIA